MIAAALAALSLSWTAPYAPRRAAGAWARQPSVCACAAAETLDWLDRFIIQHQLCPFAGGANRIATRAVTCGGGTGEATAAFARELAALRAVPAGEHATTLLLLPAFGEFEDLMALHSMAEAVEADGVAAARVQVLAFHPQAAFGDAADAADVAMRSPYPMLHLLRDADVQAAEAEWLAKHGAPPNVQERNAAYLRGLGYERASALGARPAHKGS